MVDPAVLRGPMQDFHAQLQIPPREALEDLGEPEVARMAETIDTLIVHARSRLSGTDGRGDRTDPDDRALALLRRLIGGYLQLAPE